MLNQNEISPSTGKPENMDVVQEIHALKFWIKDILPRLKAVENEQLKHKLIEKSKAKDLTANEIVHLSEQLSWLMKDGIEIDDPVLKDKTHQVLHCGMLRRGSPDGRCVVDEIAAGGHGAPERHIKEYWYSKYKKGREI